ncbi:MAG TPA: hypothetical protein VF094_00605 [Gaiellaceae bacterium]
MTGSGLAVAPVRLGRYLNARTGARLVVGTACAGGVVALFMRQFGAPGAEMDEGMVLAYSERVFHGAVPWRDFLTFYGPGNLWLVGGASRVFGLSVATERSVGLGYRLAIVLALYLVARRFGAAAGFLAVVVSAFLLAGQGVQAIAFYGSVAFAVSGAAALAHALATPAGRRRSISLVAGGLLFGCCFLVRFDLLLAAALPMAVLLGALSWRERMRTLVAFLVVAGAYLPQTVLAGRAGLERLAHQLLASEPGRRLPFPTPRGYPGLILAPSILATALLVIVGAVLLRADRRDLQARLLLAAGLLSAALLPTTLSRADGVHVVAGCVVSLALLPALVAALARRVGEHSSAGLVQLSGYAAALGVSALAVAVFFGAGMGPLQTVSSPYPLITFDVTVGSRSFPVQDQLEARQAQAVARAVARLATPGQSLFVGPVDLRRSNYNDAYLYYLLPQLKPASFYMELDPQTANRAGSGLARSLRTADWLILTSRYDGWSEPNSSSKLGPALPNRIVARDFCAVLVDGFDTLFRRAASAQAAAATAPNCTKSSSSPSWRSHSG